MAHGNTEAVLWDAETERNECYHYEDHHQADHVFGCGSRLLEEVARPDHDNHMGQLVPESEAVVRNSAEDNLLLEEAAAAVDNLDDGLVLQPELEEFHERHKAWVVTLPPSERALAVGNLPERSAAADRPADFACLDTLLAQGQKRLAMTPDGRDSSD